MTDSLPLYIVLALMILTAVFTVVTDRLLTAVIFSGALSVFATLGYLLLGAPDVALAEIAVGATLATVIFLVTLKKYSVFTVYLTGRNTQGAAARITTAIERALGSHELEPHLLHTQEPVNALLSRPGCDLVIHLDSETIVLYREESSQFAPELLSSLQDQGFSVTLQDSLAQSMTDHREARV